MPSLLLVQTFRRIRARSSKERRPPWTLPWLVGESQRQQEMYEALARRNDEQTRQIDDLTLRNAVLTKRNDDLTQRNAVLTRRNEEQARIIDDLAQRNAYLTERNEERSRRIDLLILFGESNTRKMQPHGLCQKPAFHIPRSKNLVYIVPNLMKSYGILQKHREGCASCNIVRESDGIVQKSYKFVD